MLGYRRERFLDSQRYARYSGATVASPCLAVDTISGHRLRAPETEELLGNDMSRDKGKNRKQARADLALYHVRHATFELLSANGYDVQTVEDGSSPLEFGASVPNDMPDCWKTHQPTIVPKVATLRDAKLFEDGSALLPDGHYCYTDTSFGREEDWREKHVPRKVFRRIDQEHDDALIRLPSRSVSVSGRCFSTLSNHHENYGHFIHDVMTRVYYEDLKIIAPGREKMIAPPFQHPILKVLFKKIFAGYEIVEARADTAIEAEELVLAANLCSRSRFNPLGIVSLARRMNRVMAPYAASEKSKVCVSRRDGRDHAGRDFINSAEFENRMRKLGYRVVEVSTLDSESQFSLWANATDIVGIHGAGMMNMIMMPKGGNYFEVAGAPSETYRSGTPNNVVRSAMAAGHRTYGIASSRNGDGRPTIDIERLVEIMNDSQRSYA